MTQTALGVDWLTEWRDTAVEAAGFQYTPMPLDASSNWAMVDGALRHRTSRFFSVIGVEERSGTSYPLIDQPDVGLLGFVVSGAPGDASWAVQMKVEPGNVGAAQLAPTIQATRSNLDRVHAGSGPPFEDVFRANATGIVSDGLWSEQGSRFLGKRNRNVMLRTSKPIDVDGVQHRWLSSRELRNALGTDFAVNTDARSVIATSPWSLIGSPVPFSGDLQCSYLHHDPGAGEQARRVAARARSIGLRRIPLCDLPDAEIDGGPTPLRHPRFNVVHRSVNAATREVGAWDQPLVAAPGQGRIDLALHRGPDGILRAVLGVDASAGLMAGPELTATRVDPPGEDSGPPPVGEIAATTLVSDEGGRFDHAVSTVAITIGEVPPGGPFVELTLGDLEAVIRSPMTATNELRTAVALLLSLA